MPVKGIKQGGGFKKLVLADSFRNQKMGAVFSRDSLLKGSL